MDIHGKYCTILAWCEQLGIRPIGTVDSHFDGILTRVRRNADVLTFDGRNEEEKTSHLFDIKCPFPCTRRP